MAIVDSIYLIDAKVKTIHHLSPIISLYTVYFPFPYWLLPVVLHEVHAHSYYICALLAFIVFANGCKAFTIPLFQSCLTYRPIYILRHRRSPHTRIPKGRYTHVHISEWHNANIPTLPDFKYVKDLCDRYRLITLQK